MSLINITNTSTQVVTTGKNPRKIIMSNMGNYTLWISQDKAAVVDDVGFPLKIGQTIILESFKGGDISGNFYAICENSCGLSVTLLGGSS